MLAIAGGIILASLFWALLPLLLVVSGFLLVGLLYLIGFVVIAAILLICIHDYPDATLVVMTGVTILGFIHRKLKDNKNAQKKDEYIYTKKSDL